MRWVGYVVRMGERRVVYRVLVRKPEGKRPLGRPRRKRRIVLRWIFSEWDGGVNWFDMAQDTDRWWALANAVMNLRVP